MSPGCPIAGCRPTSCAPPRAAITNPKTPETHLFLIQTPSVEPEKRESLFENYTMYNVAKHYGSAEGPLGFPMQDRQAFALETILKALPKDDSYRYRKAVIARAPSETLAGERSDVSWI